jgi:amidophosphoribosyltransferase
MFHGRHSNVYGIDMPSRSELVAHGRDTDSIAAAIGADLVVFQTLADLVSSVRQFNPKITTFDCSVFTGHYVTGGVDEAYLAHIEGLRADNVKSKIGDGDISLINGKGGGSIDTNGVGHDRDREIEAGTNGSPKNGTDHTVGLHNTWNTV